MSWRACGDSGSRGDSGKVLVPRASPLASTPRLGPPTPPVLFLPCSGFPLREFTVIPLPRLASALTALTALVASSLLATPASAQINLTAGNVAIIGWQDNGSPQDAFTIVALTDWAPGTILYFTNNGWTGLGFRNPGGSTDGNGAEQLVQFRA